MALSKNKIILLVIVGMPGSGKTTYANKLVRDNILDGFSDDYEYAPINELNPRHRTRDQELIDALSDAKKWAIADTRYCDPLERAKLEKALTELFPSIGFRYEYFENNTELCEHNAKVRKGGALPRHEINLMYYYTDLYEIPAGAKVKMIVPAS